MWTHGVIKEGSAAKTVVRELKLGIGIERIPCGQLEADAVFFRIGTLVYPYYNLF